MNGKSIKEIRKIVREEMPAILAQEVTVGMHTRLAGEMKAIINDVVPQIIAGAQYQALGERLTKEVNDRLNQIDAELKRSIQELARGLESLVKPAAPASEEKASE
jgi:uncharacterized phage infection (PIP) family protein YhgE